MTLFFLHIFSLHLFFFVKAPSWWGNEPPFHSLHYTILPLFSTMINLNRGRMREIPAENFVWKYEADLLQLSGGANGIGNSIRLQANREILGWIGVDRKFKADVNVTSKELLPGSLKLLLENNRVEEMTGKVICYEKVFSGVYGEFFNPFFLVKPIHNFFCEILHQVIWRNCLCMTEK